MYIIYKKYIYALYVYAQTLQLKEVKNGRLAMLAFGGLFHQQVRAPTHTHTPVCTCVRVCVLAPCLLSHQQVCAFLLALARARVLTSGCPFRHLASHSARAHAFQRVCVCVFLESADGLAGLGWIPAGGPPDPPAPPPLPCRAAAGAAARTLASGKRADPRTRTPLPPSARPTNAPIRRARGAPRRQLFSKTGSIAFLGDFKPLTF